MKSPSKLPKKKISKKSPVDDKQQIGELTAHLQRLQAEFENYKKRVANEQSTILDSAKASVLADLLPALDNFDRAATHLPAELENNAWAKGMQYVGQQLLDILDGMGVTRFSPLGEMFDHARHDAIETVDTDKPPGTVVEVIIPGYEIHKKVIRPAQVKVASETVNNKGENNE